jgi:hypothetical protein
MRLETYKPSRLPDSDGIDPDALYVGLPKYGWITLDRATSDPQYLDALTDQLIEAVKGEELLRRIEAGEVP